MTTKQYLHNIPKIRQEIRLNTNEIVILKGMRESITIEPKEVNVQSSGNKDLVGTVTAKLLDLENETVRLMSELDKAILQIKNMKTGIYKELLFGRYVMEYEWKRVEYDIKRSKRYTKLLHEEAISEFEELYGKEYLTKAPKSTK